MYRTALESVSRAERAKIFYDAQNVYRDAEEAGEEERRTFSPGQFREEFGSERARLDALIPLDHAHGPRLCARDDGRMIPDIK